MGPAIPAGRRGPRGSSRASGAWTVLAFTAAFVLGVAVSAEEPANVDSLLARAGRALDGGDVDVAENLFAEVLSASKGDARAEHGLAVVALRRGDHDAVIERARRAIKHDKRNSEYHLTLAYGYGLKAQMGGIKAMFYGGKFKGECELAIKYDPENVDAHAAVLQYYVMAPGFAGGGLDKAQETAATIASLDPASGHLARAFIASASDDPEGAEREYIAAARVDTLDSKAWRPLAMFYVDERRYEEAVAAWERVLTLDPDDLGATYQLAKARLLLGDDLEAAAAGFRRYIEAGDRPAEPDLASAHWRLGMVHEKGGDYAAARAEWEAALELRGDHDEAGADLDTLRAERPELW